MASADSFIRYRKLVVDVAKKLSKSDCAELVFIYQLGDKYNGETALRVIEGLLQTGIVTLPQPETLKEVVQTVKRNDLSREIDKHIKDWAKQDKKRQPSLSGATCNAKLLSLKDANIKARFDQVIFQAEWLVTHIEELRTILSADDDEVYHKAERILGEILKKTDDLKSRLKTARSEAKLGDTAFSDLSSACHSLKIELSKTVCHSDPLTRKSYGKTHSFEAVQKELTSVRSRGSSIGNKRPIFPKAPMRKDPACGAQQTLQVNPAPGQRLSATSDYSTGSDSFGDTSSFLKVQLPNSVNDGKDVSDYECLNTKAITEKSDYATLTLRSSHPEGSEKLISSEGTMISKAEDDKVYQNVTIGQ